MGLFDKCMTLPLEEQLLTIGRIKESKNADGKKKHKKTQQVASLAFHRNGNHRFLHITLKLWEIP